MPPAIMIKFFWSSQRTSAAVPRSRDYGVAGGFHYKEQRNDSILKPEMRNDRSQIGLNDILHLQ